ncbi:zinc finger CCCH domain protein [Parasponia andersonii]|uniref:Zinc finger CCCH domain protein n=1 Tax=Parasponia andersonii TaxID=3476 RepID=A0A2P5AF43_PARAD|nr:zinc finger CCCH domain protein [Parasponia andersonii]
MEMVELGDRSELGAMQREEERERRRMRDRQRRQSMTLEQRELHLARRRRNYRLRRLRAETTMIENMVVTDENQPLNSFPEMGFNDHGINPMNGLVQGIEKLNVERLESMAMGPENLAKKSANVTKKLRLSQIRCLARSTNRFRGGVGGSFQNVADVTLKRDADTTLQLGDNDLGRLPDGLRLNRIKRLARTLNTVNNETNCQSHQGTCQNM